MFGVYLSTEIIEDNTVRKIREILEGSDETFNGGRGVFTSHLSSAKDIKVEPCVSVEGRVVVLVAT